VLRLNAFRSREWDRQTDRHFFSYCVYCTLSKSTCILVKINCHTFRSSWGDCVFLIPVLCQLLEQNMHITLIMDYYFDIQRTVNRDIFL
jgi:hypothetical protein